MVLGALVAVAVALVWRDAERIRTTLTGARAVLVEAGSDADVLRSPEGRAGVTSRLDAAAGRIAEARTRLTSSRALGLVRHLPGAGRQHQALAQMIEDAGTVTEIGRDLISTVDDLAAASLVSEGRVPVEALGTLARATGEAGRSLGSLQRSGAGLIAPLGDARAELNALSADLAERLGGGADAIEASLSFMGQAGPRRYLLALHNNAEMRNQGAVLSYATVGLDRGRLSFGADSGSISELSLDEPVATPLPPGTAEVFGSINPTTLWQSVNATADYGLSGRIMVDMYHQATGTHLDGVIGVDVPGLASLLRVTGPVEVDGIPDPITAENVAEILLDELYDGLGPGDSQAERRERLGDVTEAVASVLTSAPLDAVALGRELGEAAAGGHLRLFSTEDGEQQVFERTGLGGGPGSVAPDRSFHLAVENRNATKVDYFLRPRVEVTVDVTPAGTVVVGTRVTLDNGAPVGAAPSYQLGPDTLNGGEPGDYLAWVLLWGPQGSDQPGSVRESGLELSQRITLVPASQQRTVEFDTTMRDALDGGELELRFVPQARLYPVDLTVTLNAPGRRVSDPLRWSGPWDRPVTLRWRMTD